MGAWQAAALASQFGLAVIGTMVAAVFLGQFLDRRLGTAPAFFLIGLLLGLATSVYLIYVTYRVQVQPGRPVGPEGPRPGRRSGSPEGERAGTDGADGGETAGPDDRADPADSAGRDGRGG